MKQKIKQLEIEQVSMRREIQQASADAHFWRERALAAESGGWRVAQLLTTFATPICTRIVGGPFWFVRGTSSVAKPKRVTVLSDLAWSRSWSPRWLHA